jgi:RNAse (barnase) inhibitor barstar
MKLPTGPQQGMLQQAPERRHVFISYSHADNDWVVRLKRMMAPLLRGSGQELRLWDDSQIDAGRKWREAIETALAQAKVALLLVSDHFLASEFVMGEEVPKLLAAAEAEGVRVLWVSLSACLVEKTAIFQYQAVLPPSRPLDQMAEAEVKEALKVISLEIHEAITDQNMTSGSVEQSRNLEKEVLTQLPNAHNLDAVWKLVLTNLELPTTRLLLSQNAKLLHLDSYQAVVGVRSNWMAMLQSRLPLLESAIAKAEGSRRVTLIPLAEASAPPGDLDPDVA